jgi:hypothetical protein
VAPTIRVLPTEDLAAHLLADLTALCAAAFNQPAEKVWSHIGPGIHVVALEGSRPVSHAMVIDRRIWLGHEPDQALDVGYVENVATWPDLHGRGHGSLVMERVNHLIAGEYALGGLATSSNGFYERLGWETWQGPTSVRMLDGERVRSAGEDGHVMILRTPRTPSSLDVAGPIAVDWRAEEPW